MVVGSSREGEGEGLLAIISVRIYSLLRRYNSMHRMTEVPYSIASAHSKHD